MSETMVAAVATGYGVMAVAFAILLFARPPFKLDHHAIFFSVGWIVTSPIAILIILARRERPK